MLEGLVVWALVAWVAVVACYVIMQLIRNYRRGSPIFSIRFDGCLGGSAGWSVFFVGLGSVAAFVALMFGVLLPGYWQGPHIALRYCAMALAMSFAYRRCRQSIGRDSPSQVLLSAAFAIALVSFLVLGLGAEHTDADGDWEPEMVSEFVRIRNASSIGIALFAACIYGTFRGVKDEKERLRKKTPGDDSEPSGDDSQLL